MHTPTVGRLPLGICLANLISAAVTGALYYLARKET